MYEPTYYDTCPTHILLQYYATFAEWKQKAVFILWAVLRTFKCNGTRFRPNEITELRPINRTVYNKHARSSRLRRTICEYLQYFYENRSNTNIFSGTPAENFVQKSNSVQRIF